MRHFLKILQVTMSWKILGTHHYFLDFFPKTFISISLSPVSVLLGGNKMVTSFRQNCLGGGKRRHLQVTYFSFILFSSVFLYDCVTEDDRIIR